MARQSYFTVTHSLLEATAWVEIISSQEAATSSHGTGYARVDFLLL